MTVVERRGGHPRPQRGHPARRSRGRQPLLSSSTAGSSAATSASRARPRGSQLTRSDAIGRDEALVIVGVPRAVRRLPPALLVGDVLFELDGHAVGSPEHLLES